MVEYVIKEFASRIRISIYLATMQYMNHRPTCDLSMPFDVVKSAISALWPKLGSCKSTCATRRQLYTWIGK